MSQKTKNLKHKILNFLNNNISIRKRNPVTIDVYNEIINNTQFLPQSAKIKERIYIILQDIFEIPVCVCGKKLKFMGPTNGYRQFCSTTCAANASDVQQKKQNTCFKNYGVLIPAQSPTIRDKMWQTTFENLGVKHSQQSKVIQTKTKKTNMKKHGVEAFTSSETFKKKSKETLFSKYGVTNINEVPEIQEQRKQTLLTKYNVQYPSQIHLTPEALLKSKNRDWLINEHHNNKRPVSDIASELGYSQSQLCKLFHKQNIQIKHYFQSAGEIELYNLIKTTLPNEEIIQSDRSILGTKELDIYIPSKKLAFEYNGIYWHSELSGKNKNYHLEKTNLCKERGIRLVHIWDKEWLTKQDIVISRINAIINLSTTIYARKCNIVEPTKSEVSTFMKLNHIQGHIGFAFAYGLVYNNTLVSVLTMGKSRFTNKYEYELIRYANILNTCIVGGASKLFKCFITDHNPTNIITYSDKRWNTGNLYKKLGFKYINNTHPNYFYFKPSNTLLTYSRQKFQKHKLKNKLNNFNQQLTEWENMKLNGYDRIWDCGNEVFEWRKK